jgi:hypothetical protein
MSAPVTLGPTVRDPHLRPRGRGIWLGALLFIALGVGGAVAFVKSTEDPVESPPTTPTKVVGEPQPADPEVKPPIVAPAITPDAAIADEGTSDGIADPLPTATDTATTATIDKPVMKKPPLKKPPVKKPPVKKPPEIAKPPVIVKPKCDPFDSRVKC